MTNVLLAGRIHDAGTALIKKQPGFILREIDCDDFSSNHDDLAWCDALILRTQPLGVRELEQAQSLKMVSRFGVGYDAVDVGALTGRKIPLTVVGDANAYSVAEHALALILSSLRCIPGQDRALRGGDWKRRDRREARECPQKRLLIVGFGRIGRIVARLAAVFEMSIIVYDPFLGAGQIDDVERVSTLEDGLAKADIVTLHVPAQNGVLFGPAEFARLKPGAIIINTARGTLIDEASLLENLNSHRVAAAGLDVFASEPVDGSHPLVSHPRVISTPHSAALTEECSTRMSVVACQNVIDFVAGSLDPKMVINKDVLT